MDQIATATMMIRTTIPAMILLGVIAVVLKLTVKRAAIGMFMTAV